MLPPSSARPLRPATARGAAGGRPQPSRGVAIRRQPLVGAVAVAAVCLHAGGLASAVHLDAFAGHLEEAPAADVCANEAERLWPRRRGKALFAEDAALFQVYRRHNRDFRAQFTCHTAVVGEPCYAAVAWARSTGINTNPEWYFGLKADDSFVDFQAYFYWTKSNNGVCPYPCGLQCQTAVQGQTCYNDVTWAKNTGINTNPEWYAHTGLTPTSTFEHFQGVLTTKNANCPQPCPPELVTTTTTARATTTTTTTSMAPISAPIAGVSYDKLEGPCRTATGGSGAFVVQAVDPPTCEARCSADTACVAYEHDLKSRCELHSAGTTKSDPAVAGFTCWLKRQGFNTSWGFRELAGPCRTQTGGAGDFSDASPKARYDCQEACSSSDACVAYEVDAQNRCELHRAGTVKSDPAVGGFSCSLKAAAFRESAGACRTASGGVGTYTTIDTSGAGECRNLCTASPDCVAAEISKTGRCELHKPGTVKSDESVFNFVCWIRYDESSQDQATSTESPPLTTAAPTTTRAPQDCTAVWDTPAVDILDSSSRYTCGQRITYLKSPEGGSKSDSDAKAQIASEHAECEACWPWPKYKAAGDDSISPKRGIALENKRVLTAALPSMAKLVSWAYNWGYDTSPSDTQGSPSIAEWEAAGIKWLPMLWNEFGLVAAEGVATSKWVPGSKTRRALLGFNEPNYPDQANMSPERAAELWPRVEALAAKHGIDTIVSPAVNFNANFQGTDWLGRFFELCKGCKVDAVAFHSYTCYAKFLKDHINIYRVFGKPLWLTEFACAEGGALNAPRLSMQGQMAYMREAIPMLEKDPDIEMYAWFSYFAGQWAYPVDGTDPDAGLVRPDGTLSDLGRLYASFAQG